MIHPSYVDLMNVVNKGVEEGETPVINSRYSIVMATAKRARQIVDGDDPLIVAAPGKKPLSIAVEELNQEKITILPEDEKAEEREEAEALRQALRQCTEFSSIDKDAVAEEEGIENIDEEDEDAADADADADAAEEE